MKNLLFVLPFVFFASQSQAVQSINVQTFNPSTSDHFVFLEDGFKSEWPKVAKYYFGVNYNYVNEPLVATFSNQGSRAFTIINSIQTVDLMFGFKATSRFGLFFGAPIHFITYPDSVTNSIYPTGSASGLGDLKVLGKIRISDDPSPLSISLIPEIHLPTGNTGNFVSDASTYFAARLAIERQFENLSLAFNIGFAAAPNSIYETNFSTGIDYRKRLLLGLGAFFPINDQWGANVEFSTINIIPFDKNINPNDFYLGIRDQASEEWALTLGGSLGKIGGATGQNYRVIAGLRYTFFDADAAKAQGNHFVAPPMPKPMPEPVKQMPAPQQNNAVPTINGAGSGGRLAIFRAQRIELLSPINFENDSAVIKGDSTGVLNEVADILKNNAASYKKIYIDGHTSSPGGDAYNLRLSLNRSKAVKAYLVKHGIPKNKLEARGFGRRHPKVSYKEPRAAEMNRRVEFIVVN